MLARSSSPDGRGINTSLSELSFKETRKSGALLGCNTPPLAETSLAGIEPTIAVETALATARSDFVSEKTRRATEDANATFGFDAERAARSLAETSRYIRIMDSVSSARFASRHAFITSETDSVAIFKYVSAIWKSTRRMNFTSFWQ